jgi:hypothetical protein
MEYSCISVRGKEGFASRMGYTAIILGFGSFRDFLACKRVYAIVFSISPFSYPLQTTLEKNDDHNDVYYTVINYLQS